MAKNSYRPMKVGKTIESKKKRFNPARGSGGNNSYRPKKSISVLDSKETRFDPKK